MGEIADTLKTQIGIIIKSATPAPPKIVQVDGMSLLKAVIAAVPKTKMVASAPPRPPETTKPQNKAVRAEKKEEPVIKEEAKREAEKVRKKVSKPKPKPENIFSEVQKLGGVHINLYDYFDVSPSLATQKDVERLQEIHNWAFDKTDEKGAFRRIEDLEIKLGKRSMGESKLNALYNHIKIRKIV